MHGYVNLKVTNVRYEKGKRGTMCSQRGNQKRWRRDGHFNHILPAIEGDDAPPSCRVTCFHVSVSPEGVDRALFLRLVVVVVVAVSPERRSLLTSFVVDIRRRNTDSIVAGDVRAVADAARR